MPLKSVDTAIKVVVGPAIEDGDFKTRDEGIAWNAPGMEVDVILELTDGTVTTTAVTPTTAGDYDWEHAGQGYYELELPASGASFDNDTLGILHVVVYVTGVLPFRSASYDILPAKVYDSLAKGTDSLEVDVTAVAGVPAAAEALLFESGEVHVDDGGTASTAFPFGAAPFPVDTIARGKTVADAHGLHDLHLHGTLALAAPMEHYSFFGDHHVGIDDLLNLNGQSVEHATFDGLIVTGVGGNAGLVGDQTHYFDCLLYAHTNIQGIQHEGEMGGACSVRDTGYYSGHDVEYGVGAPCTLTLQAPSRCVITEMRGTLTIAGMDGGAASIAVSSGAVLILNNTNSGGTITITGTGTLTDNSAGTVVNDLRDTAQTGDGFARLGAPAGASISADVADVPTVAEFNARTILSGNYFDPTTDAVAEVTLVDTTTTNTDMRGTNLANTMVPDMAGTAGNLHAATNLLIGAIAPSNATLANQTALLARLTAERGAALDNLDATISSRARPQDVIVEVP